MLTLRMCSQLWAGCCLRTPRDPLLSDGQQYEVAYPEFVTDPLLMSGCVASSNNFLIKCSGLSSSSLSSFDVLVSMFIPSVFFFHSEE